MNKTTFKKVTNLKGTGKTKEGYFYDLPKCPCCGLCESGLNLVEHLKTCNEAIKMAKKYGSGY
jgi:hypothetical protein